jgi:hypothetical protein
MSAENASPSGFVTSLHCARIRDELTISLSEAEVFFFEVVTVVPEVRPDNLKNTRNVASFFILPILAKEPQGHRLLFPVLKPSITVSSGKVRDVTFRDNQGGEVDHPATMTTEGLCRFEVEFGSDIPQEFTVVISMMAKRDPNSSWSELVCKMTDDNMGQMFSKPDSKLRVLDSKGTQWVFREGKAEMRPDARGWVSVEVEKQYIVQPDIDVPSPKPPQK